MPELPEVETIRLQLEKFLVGHTVTGIDVITPKIFSDDKSLVLNAKIIALRRFGKALIIDLNNNYSLMVHLKMTGQLIYRGPNLKPPKLSKNVTGLPGKHTHVIFHLDQKATLYFNDVRKFGYVKILKTEDINNQSFIKALGPEPLKNLTLKYFTDKLVSSSQPIKLFLLDQKKVSGIGNIYANDALWLSHLHPARPANSLTKTEIKKLLQSINQVINLGLKYSGASDNSYVTATGGEGSYQEHFLVYNQKGILCPNCKKNKIEKTRIAGRGTYFCPHCQK